MLLFIHTGTQMGSQPELDSVEKSEICVRSKAPELIGRLACVMWVYSKGTYFPIIYSL